MQVQKLLRRSEVESQCGISSSTLYWLIKHEDFPKPIKLGKRAVAWLESDVARWQSSRISDRDGSDAQGSVQ